MAVVKAYNLAKMTTATTGTGTITLGSAVSGFLSFAGAGVQDGETVSYGIRDSANSEVGRGVYTHSTTTLTRSVLTSTNSNSAINLSGSATVFLTPLAEDVYPALANRNITSNAPLASQFTTSRIIVRSGGTSDSTAMTLTDQTGQALLHDPGSGTRVVKFLMRPIPSGMQAGNAFEVAARFLFLNTAITNSGVGLGIGDGTNQIMWSLWMNGTFQLYGGYGATSGSFNYPHVGYSVNTLEWLRISYDASSNLTLSISRDGVNWFTVYTDTLSGMGCSAPTEYGLSMMRYDNGTVDGTVPYLFSTELTAPTAGRLA